MHTTWRNRMHVRTRCRWKNKIKIDVKEKGWDRVDWILVEQDKDKWIS